MNVFVELAAALVSRLGCHVVIHLKRVGFECKIVAMPLQSFYIDAMLSPVFTLS